MDTTRVVSRAAAGDDRAWDELVGRYDRMLQAVGAGMRIPRCDTEDAAQLTWLALHENIHAIRDPEHVGAWLCSVMRRRCLHLAVRRHREVLDDHLADRALPDEPAPSVLPAEMTSLLWQLVDRLPGREQILLRALFDGTDRSYREVAHVLGMPVGSVGPVRMRALKRLSALVADAGIRAEDLFATSR